MKKWSLFVLILSVLIFPSGALSWERSTPNVPPDSYLYRDLDKLVAFGLVHPPILGQRPYPRSEFARLTEEALENFANQKEIDDSSLKKFAKGLARKRQIKNILERLKKEFKDELIDMGAIEGEKYTYRFHLLDDFTIYTTYLSSTPTTLPVNNGLGIINAQINPLRDYDLGRHAIDGGQQAFEATGYFETGRFFSALVRPRFEVNVFRSNDMNAHAYIQNAYATFKAGNFALEVGRDSLVWGIGERGGLLLSTNPRPLDQFHITNPKPARLPWVFKYLGEWRYTLFAANLGPGYSRKWAWLAGYKLSLMPIKYLELGFGHIVTIGGEGAPTPSALDVIGEFCGFRPAGSSSTSTNFTNHLYELEYMVRIVPLRGLQIYGDISIDDKLGSFKNMFKYGGAYLWGLYLPALNSTGSADLRVEYVRVGPLQYRHVLYPDGYTLNRKLIGSDAGPDADTLHVNFRHTLSPKIWYGVTFDWDYRRSDTWTQTRNPDGTVRAIVKTATGPVEQRYRGLLDLDWQIKKHLTFHFTFGYERALNYNFTQGADRNNYLAALSVKLDLDRYFGFVAR